MLNALAPLLIALAVLAPPLAAGAAERPVAVTTTAHEVVEGTFAGATAAGVAVRVAGQRLEIAWEQVATLSFVGAVAAGGPGASSSAPSGLVGTPPSRSGAARPPSGGGRCQATTQKGTQCSRKAQAGSNYCWQHQR